MTKLKDSDILHRRLGHPSDKILNSFLKFSLKKCIDCDVCKLAKQTRLPFSLSNSKSEALFDLIHSDIWGPASTILYNGFRYFVIFIDDFSRSTWLYLLKSKDEVFNCFQEFNNRIENQYNGKIKVFRSDNSTECINNKFMNFCKEKGIIHQNFLCKYASTK
jgi:Integrase core domain